MGNDKLQDFREEILSIVLDGSSYVPLKMIDEYILLFNESENYKKAFIEDIMTIRDELSLKRASLIKEKENLIRD